MSIADILRRRPRQLDADDTSEIDDFDRNDAVRRKQLLYLGAGGAVALVLGAMYIFDGDEEDVQVADSSTEVEVSTDDLVNRNMSQRDRAARAQIQ